MNFFFFFFSKREEAKVSQEAIAFKLGISQAAYSKIERGDTKIKVDQLYSIADYLDISIYEILPPSLASDISNNSLLGIAINTAKIGLKKYFLVSKEQTEK